ncbi:MAG: hypothetical protein DRP74_01415 [Candidatus Omnitrophota bacterium]|nr:MAG: hypothetical protein DRP74_01415 [Candidatus Omnitrophota bacterium]
MLPVLIVIPIIGILLFLLDFILNKHFPEVNMGVVAFTSGILMLLIITTLNFIWVLSKNYFIMFIAVSFLNFFIGWIIARPKVLYFLRNLLGGTVAKTGAHLSEDRRPTFAWRKTFEGKAIPTPMEVKKHLWLHGFLASFISSSLLFSLYLSNSYEQTYILRGIYFFPLGALKSSFLGWCSVLFLIFIFSVLGSLGAFFIKNK